MELLSLHIEYLLTRHDCVIVPGIGAFIATETEASVDFERGIISPRRREISFNGSVVTDDGLLSHSIARREHLSYEEAHRMLSAITNKIRTDLREEGEISIGMVGRLFMDAEGLISFQPRRSRITDDILPAIAFSTISAENSQYPDMADMSNISANGGSNSDYYVIRISKRAVHAAAMLITILTVGLSLLIPINHDNTQKASVVSIPDIIYVPDSTGVPSDTIQDQNPITNTNFAD